MSCFALVDCNNFYVSCERVFQPRLQNKPVLVLTNNDGCVVARSNEVKALGIKMGVPFFQVKPLVAKHQITVFSSNYALYGDFSRRVVSRLRRYVENLEIYSIDECFLEVSGYASSTLMARNIQKDIPRSIGIPVCVGIGGTKTLAKLANYTAKKFPQFYGVCNFNDWTEDALWQHYAQISVEEIWGIGRRLAAHLNHVGIHTVAQFMRLSPRAIRQQFSVVEEKIFRELHGEACLQLEEVSKPKQQIMSSRSFGERVTEINDLEAAISRHVHNASAQLRAQGSIAGAIMVFIRTNPHSEHEPFYQNSVVVPLVEPSDDLLRLQNAASSGLRQIFKAGFRYMKAGIMLEQLQPKSLWQGDLFTCEKQRDPLMRVLDQVNAKYGKKTLRSAAELLSSRIQMRQERKSPAYTTCWDDVLAVS